MDYLVELQSMAGIPMDNSDSSSNIIKQLSYRCPGLHDKSSRQNIKRETFQNFLSPSKDSCRMIIPLFQRRYCWKTQVEGWWMDTIGGKRDHLGVHNSGNIVVHKSEKDKNAYIVIDGQQRVTTTSLLIASIRDYLHKLPVHSKENEILKKKMLARLHDILYYNRTELAKYLEKAKDKVVKINDGDDLEFVRVVPSYSDRLAFFTCIMEGIVKVEMVGLKENSQEISLQRTAKSYFDKQISKYMENISNDLKLEQIHDLSEKALLKMGLTLVDIQNEINMAQVFLWLQEKTLFSEAAILHNPNPGEDFYASDLVRNQILSCIMSESLETQEKFYRENWLFPLDRKFASPESFSKAIYQYVMLKIKSFGQENRHVSNIERTAIQFRSNRPIKGGSLDNLMIYAQFYSIYEQKLRTKANLPPLTMHSKESNQDELSKLVLDNQCLIEISKDFLEDLKNFIEKQLNK